MIINEIWFRCKACDVEITPHLVKVPDQERDDLQQWEWLCGPCRAKVPRWNPETSQWNNDSSSIRFTSSSRGDGLDELLTTLHHGGTTNGAFSVSI